jgi:hypothetical protein
MSYSVAMVDRHKNQTSTKKVEPWLPADAHESLQELGAVASYGSTPNEVARYLIARARSGVSPPSATY